MSKNMVERVARGIRQGRFERNGRGAAYDPDMPLHETEIADARAAIEAIRPTPAEMEDIRRAVKASAICNPAADVSTLANVALDKFFEIALKP